MVKLRYGSALSAYHIGSHILKTAVLVFQLQCLFVLLVLALDIFIIRQLLLHFAQLALQFVNLLFVFGIALGVAGEGGQPVADLLRSPVGGGKDSTQYAALGGLAVAVAAAMSIPSTRSAASMPTVFTGGFSKMLSLSRPSQFDGGADSHAVGGASGM